MSMMQPSSSSAQNKKNKKKKKKSRNPKDTKQNANMHDSTSTTRYTFLSFDLLAKQHIRNVQTKQAERSCYWHEAYI